MSKNCYARRIDSDIPNHIKPVIALLENSSSFDRPRYENDLQIYLKEREEYAKKFF